MDARAVKGLRAERRAQQLLEAQGYRCSRSVASAGLFDLVAVGHGEIRLIQVKAGKSFLKRRERIAIAGMSLPDHTTAECWRFPSLKRSPLIERPVTFPRTLPPIASKVCASPMCSAVLRGRGLKFQRRRFCSRACATLDYRQRRPVRRLGRQAERRDEPDRTAYRHGYKAGWAAADSRWRRWWRRNNLQQVTGLSECDVNVGDPRRDAY